MLSPLGSTLPYLLCISCPLSLFLVIFHISYIITFNPVGPEGFDWEDLNDFKGMLGTGQVCSLHCTDDFLLVRTENAELRLFLILSRKSISRDSTSARTQIEEVRLRLSYLFLHSKYFSVDLYHHLTVCPSTYLPIHLSIYPSIHLPIYLSIYLSTCQSIYLSSCTSVYMSVRLCISVCLSVCLSVYLSMRVSIASHPHSSSPFPLFLSIPLLM